MDPGGSGGVWELWEGAVTQGELNRLVQTWQRRLRLQDWKISAQFATQEELEDEVAHIDYEDEEIWAKIKVLDRPEVEADLVHELMHLRLDDWETEYHEPKKERAINLLTDCFLSAYKRRKRKARLVPLLEAAP